MVAMCDMSGTLHTSTFHFTCVDGHGLTYAHVTSIILVIPDRPVGLRDTARVPGCCYENAQEGVQLCVIYSP